MFKMTYSYADIGLVPTKKSIAYTRDNVDLYTASDYILYSKDRLNGSYLRKPIMNAPMATVASIPLLNKLTEQGYIGVLNRTVLSQDIDRFNQLTELAKQASYFSIGIPHPDYDYIEALVDKGIRNICIDVANGYSHLVLELCEKTKKQYGDDIRIITGNIASVKGFLALKNAGVDGVRVGIGAGAGCSTSTQTGIGVGQASLIREICTTFHDLSDNPAIIADGGIREVADICKAFALGADMVMIGSMFAGTDEAGGEEVLVNNRRMKRFAGQASELIKGSDKYVEGVSTLYPMKGPLENILNKISDGLKSCISYMGGVDIHDIKRLRDDNLCLLSPNARYERTPHGQDIR